MTFSEQIGWIFFAVAACTLFGCTADEPVMFRTKELVTTSVSPLESSHRKRAVIPYTLREFRFFNYPPPKCGPIIIIR